MGIACYGRGVYMIPWMVWSTFSHVQIGVRTLARIVCALFSSFWQCQKTDEKIGPEKSAPRCPSDRGEGYLGNVHTETIYFKNTIGDGGSTAL